MVNRYRVESRFPVAVSLGDRRVVHSEVSEVSDRIAAKIAARAA
ncbi:transcriptional regulator [Mesorhizobium sp. M0833]